MTAHPLQPYLSPEAREARLDALAARAGGCVEIFGRTVEGRPLRAARVPTTGEGGAARVLCTANIHGLELVAGMVALGLLERLADPAGPEGALRRRAEVWVIPCLNPDGNARTWTQQGRGRLVELRGNARGVDLNRNFPLPGGARPSHLPGAGSTRQGSATYRGTAPLSEPETAALDRLLQAQEFAASVNLHAFMGTVIPAHVRSGQEHAAYRRLCRAFRCAQARHRYPRLASRWLDVFTGELEDHQHHALGCWAACVEVMTVAASLRQHLWAPCPFWRYNPRDPAPWVENDVPAVVAFLTEALDLGRPAGDAP